MEKNQFVDIANLDEIPPGKMKHAETDGNEILVANVEGKFYALCDRCSHNNVPLSMGHLKDNIITCPMHGARFDIKTRRCHVQLYPHYKLIPYHQICRNICSMQVNLCLVLKHTIRKNTKRKLKGIVLR